MIALGTGRGPSHMSVSEGSVICMPWYSWGISCLAVSMIISVDSIDALVGLCVWGMLVHPSAGDVLCHLCGEGMKLLPLDNFVSMRGLGRCICMWYPSLSGCSSTGLAGSSAVCFSAAAIVAACILDHMMFFIPCGSGSPPSLGAEGFFLAVDGRGGVGGVQALARASTGWGVGDWHGVEDTEYLE